MTLGDTLQALDATIRRTAPSFHNTLRNGAGEAEIDALRAAVGSLPDEVATWFRWHAGSDDGFVPGTSWGLPTIEEAIAEIHFVRSANGVPELREATFAPLVTGRDGGLMYFVAGDAGAEIREYYRGARVKTTALDAWLDAILETWTTEAAVVRVSWVRRQRSPMGWDELHLPATARAKLRTHLGKLPVKIDNGVRLDGTSAVRIREGAAPGWSASETGQVEIVLTREGADDLAAALRDKTKETFRVPGIDGLRLVLSAR